MKALSRQTLIVFSTDFLLAGLCIIYKMFHNTIATISLQDLKKKILCLYMQDY